MPDQMILTPYFLDEPRPELRLVADDTWQLITTPLPTGDQQTRMSALHKLLAEAVAGAIADGKRPVSVAGDCCTTIGFVAGLQRAGIRPKLLWFDAHGDFNTLETTPSGFLGGMPLAMLVGRGDLTMPDAVNLTSMPEADIILTDGRDLDPGEREAVTDSGMHHLMQVTALLDGPLPDGPLYVHFDVDVLHLDDLPAVSYPAVGGPTAETLRKVFRRLAQSERVVAVSVSAWNPELDADGRSRATAMTLLSDLLG
jgi:arginase